MPPDYRKRAPCYTDFWAAYRAVLPATRHRADDMQTRETAHIERFNNPCDNAAATWFAKPCLSARTLSSISFIFGASLLITIAALSALTFSHQLNLDHYRLSMVAFQMNTGLKNQSVHDQCSERMFWPTGEYQDVVAVTSPVQYTEQSDFLEANTGVNPLTVVVGSATACG